MQNSPLNIAVKQTMTSLEISELTGKRHDHVCEDVAKMLTELKLNVPDFSGTQKYGNNNTRTIYKLPHRECDILMMGYSISMRAKVYDRWLELEKVSKTPANFIEALTLALEQAKQIESLELQAKIDAPLIEFARQVMVENQMLNIGTYAKALSKEFGVKIGPNKLFEFLRNCGYLMKGRDAHERNYPYQKYIDCKYFGVKVERTHIGDVYVTQITGKGQAALAKEILINFDGSFQK